MATHDDEIAGQYASPPCLLHEVDPAYGGFEGHDPQAARDVARWRKAVRARLIAERLALPAETRARMADEIAPRLDALIGSVAGRIVGVYWPFRGELDLRGWMAAIVQRGGRVALPVVVEKARPLVFRSWAPGEKLEKGVWNIPVPASGEAVTPGVVVAPLVGFDGEGYRLGYGGGFYDRTLAAMEAKPLVIGVGYGMARLPTIYRQWHDVPMDHVIAM